MMSAIEYSTEHFCSDILGYELSFGKVLGDGFYGASIPLVEDKTEYHFYLYFKKSTLNYFAKVLLNNKNLQEDDLNDLCKEVANQIIGYAKNLLVDRQKHKYQLGTPEFLGKVSYPFPVKLEDSIIFKLKNRTFLIGHRKAS